LTTAAAPEANLSLFVASASLVCLAGLGALAAGAGGAPRLAGALRVAIWGALAMAVTAVVGRICGVVV
jgi:VIT1/CCC1 family predicted Fe2+/Mn2+ transporter